MRFVFISSMSGYPWGGSEELWSQAAVRLLEEGNHVCASVPYWPKLASRVRDLRDRGIQLHVRREKAPSIAYRVWRKVRRRKHEDFQWVQSQEPDLVVISQGANADGFAWLEFCQRMGIPYS